MDLISPVSVSVRDGEGRFRKGRSGNPRGRPKGARSLLAEKLDRMAEREAPAVLATIIDQAKAGDLDAGKMVLSRAWPARRGRPVRLNLSATAERSPLAVLTAVLEGVIQGRLTPEEAQALAVAVDAHGKAADSATMQKLEQLAAEPPRLRPVA